MSSLKSLQLLLWFQILLVATAVNGEPRRYCGPHLRNTLQILCRNKYASLRHISHDKRSGDIEDDVFINDYALDSYPSSDQFSSFDSATALQPYARREYWINKRGVVDDCCFKPCRLEELLNYCG